MAASMAEWSMVMRIGADAASMAEWSEVMRIGAAGCLYG